MDKIGKFLKSKLGFAICLSLIFCLVQIPLVLHHELSLAEAQFYHQYFAPLGIGYEIARFIPLTSTTVIIFLLSWLLPIRRLSKACIAFSSLFFYFNSVILAGFRIIPLGRDLVFSDPVEFFSSINEACYHTFLPIFQLSLIPIAIYLLDCIFHFKFLRKLEIVKLAKNHHISGSIVFILPIALSIPNAVISGIDDFYHRYNNQSAIVEVAEELNSLPEGSAIALSSQAMPDFATVYAPLLRDGRYFYDLVINAPLDINNTPEEDVKIAFSEISERLPKDGHVYFLINTNACFPNNGYEPMSNWEYKGLIRDFGGERAADFYKVR